MLYGGRVAPVQTFARDLTVKICGKPAYGKYTAEQVLAGWIFFPEQWQHEPMIRIKQDTVRKLLGSGATAALTDFFGPGRSYRLAEAVPARSRTVATRRIGLSPRRTRKSS